MPKCPLCPSQAQLPAPRPRASQCSQGCCKYHCPLVSPPSSLKTAHLADLHALRSLWVFPKPEEPWPKRAKGTPWCCWVCAELPLMLAEGAPAAHHPVLGIFTRATSQLPAFPAAGDFTGAPQCLDAEKIACREKPC